MAEDKIPFEVTVGGVEGAINSVKDLKTAIKEATNEQIRASEKFGIGSKEYDQASKRVSALKDKVDDLKDSSKSLQGSGIERSAQGFSQLGEGLKNLDFDKVKVGLGALKSALAATGVMLIVQAVTYLIENFDELSKGTGVVAKVLQFFGTIVNGLKDAMLELTDKIGLTNTALDKMGEALKSYGDIVTETISKQNAEFDRHIAIAKASGKNTIDLEIAKQEAIIRTNKVLVEQIINYVKSGGVLNEEQQKLLSQSLENIKNAKTQETIINLQDQAKKKEDYKKHLEDLNRIGAENFKRAQDEAKARADAQAALDTEDAASRFLAQEEALRLTKEQAYLAEQERLNQSNIYYDSLRVQQREASEKETNDKVLAERKAFEEQAASIAIDSATRTTSSLQSLSDLFFEFKRKNLKKGSAEDLAAAKKQFNINKALGIANATIQGVQGVIAAYSSGAAIPIIGAVMGPVFAVLAGVAAAANIAKISSAKFEEGGGGGSASSLSSGVGSASIPSPPGVSTPQNNINQSSTFDQSGKNTTQPTTITVKAQVVETEVTDKQNEMNTIKTQSTF